MGEWPVVQYGAAGFWLWGVLAALVGAAAAGAWGLGPAERCHAPSWWVCLAASNAGLAADFTVIPPDALMGLCSGTAISSGWGTEALKAHLRWLPCTSAAMVLAWAAPRCSEIKAGLKAARRASGLLALRLVAELALMLALMAWSVDLLRALALGLSIPWTVDGMLAAMMLGMLLAFRLGHLRRGWLSWRDIRTA